MQRDSRSLRRDLRNAAARERLAGARLPAAVLVHALKRGTVPDIASRAVASYWHHHPIRADRLARVLAAKSAAPKGWSWRIGGADDDGRPQSFRQPPAPFREAAHRAGPGTCCICGQPVFRLGWHRDLWGDGTTTSRARWHGCCVAAWALWSAPARHAKLLARLQKRRCAAGGEKLSRVYEVDHRVPLHVVWRRHREEPWPALLRFWGFPNLGAVDRAAHASKSAVEAAGRAAARRSTAATSVASGP